MLKLKPLILCTFLLIINFFSAQKKPLDHNVYDAWESVGSRLISNDGKWLGYYVDAQEGDGNLYLYSTINKTQQKFSRASKLFLTSDSKFAIFTVKPFYKDIKAVKDKKLKKDKLAKDSLYLVNLSTNKIEKIANVKSYKAPFKGGSFVAYFFENLKEKSTDSLKDDDKDEAKDDDDKNAKPSELVVINLTTGQKQSFQNVVKYQFSENGKQLAFVTQKPEEKKDPKDKEKDKPKDKSKPKKYALQSVNLVNLENFAVNKLLEEEGDFAQLTFDKSATQFALTGTTSAENNLVKDYNLYYFSKNKKAILNQKSPKMPKKFAEIHPKYKTPSFATIITGIAVGIPILFTDKSFILDFTSIGTIFAFVLVNGGILLMPQKEKLKGRFHLPYINAKYIFPILFIGGLVGFYFWQPEFFHNLWNITDEHEGEFRLSIIIFLIINLVLVVLSYLKNLSLIPLLGLTSCLYLLTGMTHNNWFWFGLWFIIGLGIYFFYGKKNSKLNTQNQ